jgi:hypothetical protein
MEFHFVNLLVGAPADLVAAVICFPTLKDSPDSLTKKHLSGRVCKHTHGRQLSFETDNVIDLMIDINPYPSYYRTAFAFSIILFPHLQQCALRFHLPDDFRRRFGVSAFRAIADYG